MNWPILKTTELKRNWSGRTRNYEYTSRVSLATYKHQQSLVLIFCVCSLMLCVVFCFIMCLCLYVASKNAVSTDCLNFHTNYFEINFTPNVLKKEVALEKLTSALLYNHSQAEDWEHRAREWFCPTISTLWLWFQKLEHFFNLHLVFSTLIGTLIWANSTLLETGRQNASYALVAYEIITCSYSAGYRIILFAEISKIFVNWNIRW